MENLKIGDVVELYNDQTTAVSGRVSEVRSKWERFYVGSVEPEVRVVYSIQVEGIQDYLRDYEWVVSSVNGKVVG